jgi:hypothetical protein
MSSQNAARAIKVAANYYQQFDADYRLHVPAEGYGGWKKAEVVLSLDHTAIVVMHAVDCGTLEQYPGWYRCVEYIPRSNEIARTVFPKLLSAVREAGLPMFHVVGGGNYYKEHPNYKRTVALAGPEPPPVEQIEADPALKRLREFRAAQVFVGAHNKAHVDRGRKSCDFMPQARPVGDEAIAATSQQMFALCKAHKVNHLIYAGFAINWCLLLSPGGMADMQKRGIMCSAFRQAVTAVENKETARKDLCKEIGLWRVALAFGFVFDVDEFIAALKDANR